MIYLRQIFYEMKHQKMMTWVSISGTALSIFLVMALFMTDQVKSVEIAPESLRNRILTAKNMHVQEKNQFNSSTSGISKDMIDKLYLNLDGIERVSYVSAFPANKDINLRGQGSLTVIPKHVDAEFWNIYDFKFIDGKPFDQADAGSEVKKVILSRSKARQLFGEEKVAGRDVEIDCINYNICGVVEDVNPLLLSTFAHIYLPYKPNVSENDFFGDVNMVLLMKDGIDPEYIKKQVENRYKTINSNIAATDNEMIYNQQPFTSEELGMSFGSNNSPDTEGHRKKMIAFYLVLILLPAINLSSMTRSRLRHRVSEIGVRRAFGAKKSSIIKQLFLENLIITFLGGLIGLVLSILFVILVSHLFFYSGGMDPSSLELVNSDPSLLMVFRWQSFFWALFYCLILNILSATLPAWRSSRVDPAVAIAKSR